MFVSNPSSTTVSSILPSELANAVQTLINNYSEVPTGLAYGTAGFRTLEKKLDSIVVRMGCLAALRAKQQGKVGSFLRTNRIWFDEKKIIIPDF